MATAEQKQQATDAVRERSQAAIPRPQAQREQNVGDAERAISLAAGSVLLLLGLGRRSRLGALTAGVGAAMLHRGVTGHCHLYRMLGIDTTPLPVDGQVGKAIHVEGAYLIGRSADELYRFWRNFENLPRIMHHIERIEVLDDRRSRWVAKAPQIAGGSVEWEAEITRDEPGSLIAWRSLPGSQIEHSGEVRFEAAPGDRGTNVHVRLAYRPPAGRLGHWVATLLGQHPRRQIREELRNFKRIMETGEIATVAGQPRGTCLGVGRRDT